MFKKYIRKYINKILCDICKEAEQKASECSEDYVKNDKYQNNPYRGTFHGYICGVNWLSNEISKRI